MFQLIRQKSTSRRTRGRNSISNCEKTIMAWRLSKRDGHRVGSHPVVCENAPPDEDLTSRAISEIVGGSKITIQARPKYLPLGKFALLAELNGEEAMEAFLDSNDSVSRM